MTDNEKILLIELTMHQVAINLMSIASGGDTTIDTHEVALELYKKLSEPE